MYNVRMNDNYVYVQYTVALYTCKWERANLTACLYHKVREYFVYRDGHGLGFMAIHLAHHCFSFNMRFDTFMLLKCTTNQEIM